MDVWQSGEYEISVNRVPDGQFDVSGVGFGWGFQVRETNSRSLLFRVLIKAFNAERTDENINRVRVLGEDAVQKLLKQDHKKPDYCFTWEHNLPLLNSVDCGEISSPSQQTPFI